MTSAVAVAADSAAAVEGSADSAADVEGTAEPAADVGPRDLLPDSVQPQSSIVRVVASVTVYVEDP